MDLISGGVLGMILHAGPVAKAVLAILLFFSLVSWAIILFKARQLGQMEREANAVFSIMNDVDSLKKLTLQLRTRRDSPFYTIALLAYEGSIKAPKENPSRTKENALEVERRLTIAIQEENERLEKYLSFLATTANTAPFVGLFGTVWGIMDSFREIGIRGTTSLPVVAPGISEALITTAFGLATAIPAVVGYNYLLGRCRRIALRLENFATYVISFLEK